MPVSSTQKRALHQMAVLPVPVSDCHVSCSAPDGSSGGDSVSPLCSLQCTRWQFWWWQCRPAVHQMAVLVVTVSACCVLCSTSGRLSTGWQFCQCHCQHSVFCAVHLALLLDKLPLLVQQKASQWHLHTELNCCNAAWDFVQWKTKTTQSRRT